MFGARLFDLLSPAPPAACEPGFNGTPALIRGLRDSWKRSAYWLGGETEAETKVEGCVAPRGQQRAAPRPALPLGPPARCTCGLKCPAAPSLRLGASCVTVHAPAEREASVDGSASVRRWPVLPASLARQSWGGGGPCRPSSPKSPPSAPRYRLSESSASLHPSSSFWLTAHFGGFYPRGSSTGLAGLFCTPLPPASSQPLFTSSCLGLIPYPIPPCPYQRASPPAPRG